MPSCSSSSRSTRTYLCVRALARACVNAGDVTLVWVIWRLAASEGFTESSLAYIRQLSLSLCWNELVWNGQRSDQSLRFQTRYIHNNITHYGELLSITWTGPTTTPSETTFLCVKRQMFLFCKSGEALVMTRMRFGIFAVLSGDRLWKRKEIRTCQSSLRVWWSFCEQFKDNQSHFRLFQW